MSLRDILLKSKTDQGQIEHYSMAVKNVMTENQNNQEESFKTFSVKRFNFLFDEEKCDLL